jgi:hypothetical protein
MKEGMKPDPRRIDQRLQTQDGLIGRGDALALGLTVAQIHGLLEKGIWLRDHQDVYRAAAAPRTDRQALRSAFMAAGKAAVASHRSAAWLWGLMDRAPDRPEITVPTSWAPHLNGVNVHRSRDLDRARKVTRGGIPVTDAARTLVDLGAVVSQPVLADLLDRGLALRLVTLRSVQAELGRFSRPGRRGPGPLRDLMAARGMTGAPHPSVLESKMHRIFIDYRLPLPDVQVEVGPDGEYRLDFAYPALKLAIEVDGYVWHFTPEQQRRDNERRNQLHAAGWRYLVFTWIDVTRHPDRVAAQIHEILHSLGAA